MHILLTHTIAVNCNLWNADLLHLLENTFDRIHISANPSLNPKAQ